MRELSVPVAYVVKPDDNITDDVFTNAQSWPGTTGLRRKVNGTWAAVTWREFAGEVRAVAAGFIAAGIRSGDRVGLMSRTRYEWTLLDYAILTAGGVTVPIYPTSSLEQVEWILGDSGAVAVVVETDDHAGMVATARAGLPALAHIWQIDSGGLADLKARGTQVTREQVDERRRTRGAADLAAPPPRRARRSARAAAEGRGRDGGGGASRAARNGRAVTMLPRPSATRPGPSSATSSIDSRTAARRG